MRIRLDYSRITNLSQKLQSLAATAPQIEHDVNLELARVVFREIQKGLKESPASGMTYRRYNPSRVHTASSPGQYPRIDQHKFYRSVYLRAGKNNTFLVGSVDPRALWFTYGTRKMAPRPWLVPALEETYPKTSAIVQGVLARYIK